MSMRTSPVALGNTPTRANTTNRETRQPSPLFLRLLNIYNMVSNLWGTIKAFVSDRSTNKPTEKTPPNYERLIRRASQRHDHLQCHRKWPITKENHPNQFYQQRVFTPEDDRKMWKTLLLPTCESKEEKEKREREEESKYLIDLITEMPLQSTPCSEDDQVKDDEHVQLDEHVEIEEHVQKEDEDKKDEEEKKEDLHVWSVEVEAELALIDWDALGLLDGQDKAVEKGQDGQNHPHASTVEVVLAIIDCEVPGLH
ncbi:hypothetical protein BDP55DRAFT_754518 [Colletotrichum godetiae]|uniref:Uncharacterized protein n=1 Tax=Colletotrichum godetiae TaxID=1209918 RepID=A0AAJ0AEF5_9PEZI|nr:uncharacterized protein BDP55DRAFT_754518 [Colletotrichum godetiae]KAK1660056.1 hypothetical protein BDP55DRAFT_754518 [Colletotrichum godetiae]